MSSYLVTGVSRGIGFGFLEKLSENPANTVFGIVRNKKTTDEKVASKLADRKNIHIFQADLVNYDALKKAVDDIADAAGGSLDYIIANGALISSWSAYDNIGTLGQSPKQLGEDLRLSFETNVIGNIHLFNLTIPLVLAGRGKKVITISSGMADIDLVAKYDVEPGAPYPISKAAVNVAVAKFSAQYARDGVLFMSICPGMVETGLTSGATPDQLAKIEKMGARFADYAPDFKGPSNVEDSVKAVLSVMDDASLEKGGAGSFVSHFGNKRWM